MLKLDSLYLDNNKLQGLLPGALTCHRRLFWLSMCSNHLSGTLGIFQSTLFTSLHISRNKLTGSLPVFCYTRYDRLKELTCSGGNMFEGTLPASVMTSYLEIMDVSSKVGQARGLVGQLPSKASQASALKHFTVSHQDLHGCIPPLSATLSTLGLHSDHLSAPSDAFAIASFCCDQTVNCSDVCITGLGAEGRQSGQSGTCYRAEVGNV